MDNLKREFLRLLREDEEFRLAVAGLIGLGEVLQELRRLREDFQTYIKEQEKRWRENERRWRMNERRWRANERRWREAFKRFEALERGLQRLDRRLVLLGARWGVETEEAFREAVRGIVEDVLGVGEVVRWSYFDGEGLVFGFPSPVEVDVLVKDGVHILVEVKASATDSDVAKLWRIGQLYRRATGVEPKLALVTPHIDERGRKAAEALGIQVYTYL
ncbi:Protein of unknown function DUF1626 [Pyrobaculum islandicum DSM 4184]|uniref:DUF3782 domain-containing protein n=1 Tax=Pyrobaculum islandicum (strain DSM 4184 / JCM 9189 / GEO3) TaxID=384616 RepID=A1RVT5_PYRIL|nr:DUF3782 domain-containing protein [Pyrobaculum islandicum]ABL89067.1 Protein of unknown function DUF1626 [Pyrobaculum islandicum DSM 4184]